MKIPVVKEWGSWVVFVSSLLAALTAGLLTRPWETDRDFAGLTMLTILGLALLVNSKNPLASALRTGWKQKEHVLWFFLFSISGLTLLIPFLIGGIRAFSAFSFLVLSYAILLYYGKEHSLFAEVQQYCIAENQE